MVKKIFQHIHHFQLHQNLLKGLSRISLLISIILLFYCRSISGLTSSEDQDTWYLHFVLVERISMLFLLLSCFKHIQKISWILSELLLFFLVQDIIDRVFYDIKEININDYIAIGLITIIALIKYKNTYHDNTRTNKKTV